MDNAGKLELILDAATALTRRGGAGHGSGRGDPWRCRIFLFPQELPLSVSATKMGWVIEDAPGREGGKGSDWKVPSPHISQTASRLLAGSGHDTDSGSEEDPGLQGPYETQFTENATSNQEIKTRSHQRAIRSARRLGHSPDGGN